MRDRINKEDQELRKRQQLKNEFKKLKTIDSQITRQKQEEM
jgi:cell division protein FtsL